MSESKPLPTSLTPKSFLFTNFRREDTEAVFEQAFVDEVGCEYTARWIVKSEHIGLMNEAIRHMVPAKRIIK